MTQAAAPEAMATEKAVIDNTTVDGAPVAETHASTEAHGGEAHAAPAALGMDATMWVALAMLVVIALFIWKKVPAMIGAALDKQIDGIKAQLDQATNLRKEAEAIKADYEAKAKQAAADAEAMKAHAEEEAKAIVAKAKTDATALIARRAQSAEDKIAAAERAAIADVRAKAAAAAAAAAEALIAAHHDAKADAGLVDATIAKLN
ncbi:F0F1 ATP synthase subunit B [uncultured Sphingorhabdus sp.]|uniref:F0F1 ATP synthase subunit B family protein n=1 Tax=uncultured Sphingorhabdus sp. TaxID=1686106 RepID=UPI002636A1B8|nr:F0F1 ATP synthase subunit B [uncultured Sphingorhabdus sp.]HMS19314.1 F0F1 ATP synthase subunit B [Sphingorhabdus sp.]